MTHTLDSNRYRDFLRLLGQIETLNEQLFTVLDRRIGAMKRSDVAAMSASSDEERRIVERLAERDGLRVQMMDAIGVELGLPPRGGRSLTVSQLSAQLVPAQQAGLVEAADRLRAVVFRLRQTQRVASVIAREILDHLRWVFSAAKPKEARTGVYSANGSSVAVDSSMLELVG